MEDSSCTQPGFTAVTLDSENIQRNVSNDSCRVIYLSCIRLYAQYVPNVHISTTVVNYTACGVSCLHLLLVTKAGLPRQAKRAIALRPQSPRATVC